MTDAMRPSVEWPQTRRALQARAGYATQDAESPSLDDIRAQYRSEVALATKIISTRKRDRTDAKILVAELETIQSLSTILTKSAQDWGAIVGLAIVTVLRRAPSIKTWEYLWKLAWHSTILEHNLSTVVSAYAKESKAFKRTIVDLAFKVARATDANPGRRAGARERPQAEALQDAWATDGSLTDLWWGLRAGEHFQFHDDDGMFRIIADIDLQIFVRLLASFSNPYPVRAALEFAESSWSFKRWESLIALAPPAFNADGSWNGSVITPLLLSICWQSATALGVRRDSDNLTAADEEIHVLIDRVSAVVAARRDAGPCCERWATWLMRQCFTGLANETLPYPADVASRGYVEATLISALGKQLAKYKWNKESPSDAALWEPWCYRSVLSTYALVDVSTMPAADTFVQEWKQSPEEWVGLKGDQLREKASIFESFSQRPDAYGMRLLALPLVHQGNPVENWERLWFATAAIREAVEFGSADQGEIGAPGLQYSAGRLLRLAFGIGLMMLDTLVDPQFSNKLEKQAAHNGLFVHLASAAFEMRSIDHFDQGYWSMAIRHLALRRLLWTAQSNSVVVSFNETTTPTFVDFLKDAETEVEYLLALIDGCLRNGVTQTVVREQLDEAEIDLTRCIALAERLRTLDARRSGIDESQLQAARSVIESHLGDPPTIVTP
ncbi:MAG: hypothetical protein ACRDRL_24475 [Sciscionella sp.]